MIKTFFSVLLSFIVLDFLWLGFVVKKFNLRELAEIGRIVDGDFQMLYVPAGITYLLMTVCLMVFVLPRVQGLGLPMSFLYGALMGLVVYGVFDMTNMAILKNYPLTFAIVDMAWGTTVFGLVTVINQYLLTLRNG